MFVKSTFNTSLYIIYVHDLVRLNEDQGGACSRQLEAHSWLIRPMRNRQVRSKRKVGSGHNSIVLCFILLHFLSLRAAQWLFSKEESPWLVVRCETSRFSATVDHWYWSMLYASNYFLSGPLIASVVLLCCSGQRRACRAVWFWVVNDFLHRRRMSLGLQ